MTPIHRTMIISWLVLLSGLIATSARAHAVVPVSKYKITVSWVTEPVVPGEINGVVLSIVNYETGKPIAGITTLHLSVTADAQMRTLPLSVLGGATSGHYGAVFIPTMPGVYTVHLKGQIETQAIDITQQLKEVNVSNVYQFPVVVPSLPELDQRLTALQTQNDALRDTIGLTQWLALDGIVLGFIGVVLGFMKRRPSATSKERPR